MLARSFIRSAMLLAALAARGGLPLSAAEEELQPTTEFGITITPEQIYDAIQETQDFWPPVRAYVAGDRFQVADPATRRQAADFFKRANNQLHDRMFGEDEAAALDLIDYLASRLRLFVFYRQCRDAIGDDRLAIAVKEHWEKELRQIHSLPAAQQPAQLQRLTAEMGRQLESLGLPTAKVQPCLAVWLSTLAVTGRMNQTSAGQMMLAFEREAKGSDPKLAQLIRDVVAAADWAQITKSQGTLLKRTDFEVAWRDLEKLAAQHTAETQPAPRTR